MCVSVNLWVRVWSSRLIFPLLAAGMTRGNMLARLHYQSPVDPTLARSWGWKAGNTNLWEKEGRVEG